MAASGTETEIKLRAASAAEARAGIEAAGFVEARARVFESNQLLDTPAGLLRSQGEVLRLRQCGGQPILTYKGPATRDRHKSREEIETPVDDAEALLTILARLGYEPAYRYEKFRTEVARPGEHGVAQVDETPIGTFIEVEGESEWIDRTAKQLGYSETDYIVDSYATLFRRYCMDNSLEIGAGMIYGEHPSR